MLHAFTITGVIIANHVDFQSKIPIDSTDEIMGAGSKIVHVLVLAIRG